MCQHFLLSKEARTLSLGKVLRLSDDEAYAAFKVIRFTENGGEPVCPKCGGVDVYEFKARKIFKCVGCKSQFCSPPAPSSPIASWRSATFLRPSQFS